MECLPIIDHDKLLTECDPGDNLLSVIVNVFYLIPLNFRTPFIFAPLIFAPLIFVHPRNFIFRAPLISPTLNFQFFIIFFQHFAHLKFFQLI